MPKKKRYINEYTVFAFSAGSQGATHFLIIRDPTMTRAPPVAHDGMEAKIRVKKRDTRNVKLVTTAVMPVFPPSEVTILASRR